MAYQLGRHPHPDTPKAAQLYPVTKHPDYKLSTDTYRYWWEGGAWLDQGQTGTCVGNAFAHRVADAPVPHTGIDEAYAQQLYIDASGDTTLQKGTSGILAARVLKSRGTISGYYQCTSAQELRNAILTVGSVCVGVNWYNSMFYPKIGANSRAYMVVDRNSGLAGGHEFIINGINLAPASGPPFYRMKNSWGKQWPQDAISQKIYGPGTARFALTDLEELIFNEYGDAFVITEV